MRGSARTWSLILLLPASAGLGSAVEAGERDGAFAIRGGSAFSAVLGDAYSAVGGDADAVVWNPATILTVKEPHTQATYHDVFSLGLARYSSLAVAWRPATEELVMEDDSIRVVLHRDRGVGVGISVGFLSVDLDTDSYWEANPSLALGVPLHGGASIGFAVRYMRSSSTLEGVSANGYAVEVGVHQQTGPVGLALALRNLVAELDWSEGGNESLPRELNLAISYRLSRRLMLAAGGSSNLDNDGDGVDRYNLAAMAEIWRGHWWLLGGQEGLRSGEVLDRRYVAGTRVRTGQIAVDYAFAPAADTPGDTHRATLSIYF